MILILLYLDAKKSSHTKTDRRKKEKSITNIIFIIIIFFNSMKQKQHSMITYMFKRKNKVERKNNILIINS